MVWGATCVRMAVACAHARPMVALLWKKYAGGGGQPVSCPSFFPRDRPETTASSPYFSDNTIISLGARLMSTSYLSMPVLGC